MNSKISFKKLVSLFMALVIVITTCALMSCGKKTDEELMSDINEAASEKNMTLSMYLMSEGPVDPITEKQVEDAVNAVTKKKYNTQLDLRYYTEKGYEYFSFTEGNKESVLYMNAANEVNNTGNGQMITSLNFDLATIDLTNFSQYTKASRLGYYEAIDKAIADRKAAEANGSIKVDKQNAEGSNETVLDEYGIPVPKYPAVTAYHMDIFYIGGKDNFLKYKDGGNLYKLDDEINTSAVISTNISQLFLANIKSLNGGTYAIPTSKPVGEYTYLLLNKAALEAAYLKNENGPTDYSSFTSLTCGSVKDFLDYVVSDTNTLSNEFYPISTNISSTDLLINNLQYWGVDDEGKRSDAFSVLGGYYGKDDNYLDANTYAKFENLFENEQFVNDIKTLKEYDLNSYYTEEAGKKFAVGYFKCDANDAEKLIAEYGEEYEILTVALPRVDEDDLYSDLFAISKTSSNVGRSMRILELLNSDESFRNIFLYGIEEEHYRLEGTDVNNRYGEEIKAVIKLSSSRYNMALEKTGNTFIAYPEKGDSYTVKEFGIMQNQEAKTRLDLGFEVGENSSAESLQELKSLSESIWADYEAISNISDFDAFLAGARDSINNSEAVKSNLEGGLYADYNAWLIKNKIIKKK